VWRLDGWSSRWSQEVAGRRSGWERTKKQQQRLAIRLAETAAATVKSLIEG
jgi:hypothetical protein